MSSRRRIDEVADDVLDREEELKRTKRLRKMSGNDSDEAEADGEYVDTPAASTEQKATDIDLTGAAIMTDRLDIDDKTVADGIDSVKQFSHQKGTSDGHKLLLEELPDKEVKHWTTAYCGVGKCCEKLRYKDKDGNHVCWNKKDPHNSRTYRLAYDVQATAVDVFDPLKRKYKVQFKHDNFGKLLKMLYQPAGLKVDQFVALRSNDAEWQKMIAALTAKEFPCSIYVWHDPKDASRYTLTVRP